MRRNSRRDQKVNDLLQVALAKIIQRQEIDELRGLMVTVTEVDVSPDFSSAIVFVSVLEEETGQSVIEALNHFSKRIRHLLAGAVKLRMTPALRFVLDDSILKGNRIVSLIKDAK